MGKFLSRREVAEMLNISPQTVDNLIRAGRLERVKIGRKVGIPSLVLTRYIADLSSVDSGSGVSEIKESNV